VAKPPINKILKFPNTLSLSPIKTKFHTHKRKQAMAVAQRLGLVRKPDSIFQHIYGDLLLSFELWLALFREGCAAFDTVFAVAQQAK
jgi:hypothetical protein